MLTRRLSIRLVTVALLAGCGEGAGRAPSSPPTEPVATTASASASIAPSPAPEPAPTPVATQAPAPEPAPPGTSPPPSSSNAGLAKLRLRFKACYQKGLAVNPDLTGAPKLEVVVDATGKVTSAKVICSKWPKEPTECMRKALLGADLENGPSTFTFGGPC
jgi:hypothetical protein